MKEIELKLIVELLKGSRRSDRELAKRLGVSQPTITRTRLKLEKEGKIKEYTIIPDFASLGFQLMSVTFLKLKEPYSKEARERMKTISQKLTENYPAGTILAMGGMGMNSEHVVVTYHKDYSEYHDFIKNAKSERAPLVVVDEIKSFLVDLNDKTNFLPLTLSYIARVLVPREDEWKTREKEVTSA